MSTEITIIIGCGLAAIAIPLGTFILVKTIKKLSGEPVNVLRRPNHDIELDIIEPIQSGFNPRGVDLGSIPEFPQAVIRWDTYQWRGESLPSYHTYDNITIYCGLENCVNLDLIIFVFTIFLTLYLFKQVKGKNVNFIPAIYWKFLILYWWFFIPKSSNLNMF